MDIAAGSLDQRIAVALADARPTIAAAAEGLVAQAGLAPAFAGRFAEIYDVFTEAWGLGALHDCGWHAGMASARFLQNEQQLRHSMLARLEIMRNRIFYSDVADLLDDPLRMRYFAGLGEFLTAYIRAMNTAESMFEYREIAEVARRLATAAGQDQLESESVRAAFTLLEVDYAWFTHREDGMWNISHALPGMIPLAREGRARDRDVDGIDRLLEGRALIYDDLSKGSPSVQYMGRLLRLGSALSVPVMRSGTCVGTLGVGRREPSHFDEHDLAIVQLLASQVGAAAGERKSAEQNRRTLLALQESEAGLRVLAEAIPQMVWIANADGSTVWYNRRWYDYTGQPAGEAQGWGWQAVHHPEDLPRVVEAWTRSIETGDPFEMEFRLKGADGNFRWFLTRTLPLRDERGRITKWYGTNTDIDLHKRALQRQEEIAKALQRVLIPKAFPVAAGVSFDAVYVPAENDARVGGDWYDAFALPDGLMVFSIGDVAGHGMDAAVTMGRVRQMIFSAALDSAEPSVILEKVNRALLVQDGTFVTALVGVIQNGNVRIASAGHPFPILAAPEDVHYVETAGLALGVQPALNLSTIEFSATPGTMLICYTDGIVETGGDQRSGEIRLLGAAKRAFRDAQNEMPARSIFDETLGTRALSDDAAVLVVRFIDPEQRGGVSSIQSRSHGMSWDFDSSDAQAAQSARRQVVEFLRRSAHGHADTYALETIVGELIANTVDHAPGAVHVDVDWSDASPTLVVHDQGPVFELAPGDVIPDLLSEEGRGLYLVRSFGAGVRVERAPGGGKDVVVALPVTR